MRKLVPKDWIHVSPGLASGVGKLREADEIGHTFFGDCCWEAQTRKNGVTIKRGSSL